MSQAFIKLQRKGQIVIPRSLREEVGLPEGTLLKVAVVKGGQFLVTPQPPANRPVITAPPKNRKQALRELFQVVDEIRKEAKEKGLDKMPAREINSAVNAARRDLKKSRTPRAKPA